MGTPILLTARAPLHVRFMLIVISTSESKQHQHSDSKDNEKGRARSSVAQGSSTPTAIPLDFIAGFARACLMHSIHVDNRYDAPANHEVVLSAHYCHNVMDGNETSMKILEEAHKTYAWLGTCPAMRWGSSFEVRHGTRTSTRLPWPLRVALHGIIRGANFANFKRSCDQLVSLAAKDSMPTCLALVTDLLPTPQRNEGHLLLDHPPHS
jgi:hypothetical protein